MSELSEPKVDAVAEQIAAWAATKRAIKKVWLFGSRVTGENRRDGGPPRLDSDLDIAVEIDGDFLRENHADEEDDPNRECAFCLAHGPSWEAELNRIVPWPVDLRWCWPDSAHLASFRDQSGMIIYEGPHN